jgi:hypothetical protein
MTSADYADYADIIEVKKEVVNDFALCSNALAFLLNLCNLRNLWISLGGLSEPCSVLMYQVVVIFSPAGFQAVAQRRIARARW